MSEQIDLGAPRLSVVTPVLNGAEFVEGCVRNVADQKCELCEHIVVDGGSTDDTLALLDRLVQTVPRLRVLVEPGMRQSSAVNAGIRASAGAIIGVLNVDDFYSPGTLVRVLELFSSFAEPTLLVGNCTVWSQGRELRVNRPSDLRPEALLLGPRHYTFPVNPSAYFYDKQIHEAVGFYDEHDDFTMDLDFLLRALPTVRSEYRDEPWGNFRIHEGAKTEIDKVSGRHRRRRRQVMNRHRGRLPVAKRIALRCRLIALDTRLGARLARWAIRDPTGFRDARAAGLVLAALRNAPEAAIPARPTTASRRV